MNTLERWNLLPQPRSMVLSGGELLISSVHRILPRGDSPELLRVATYLQAGAKRCVASNWKVEESSGDGGAGVVEMTVIPAAVLQPQGYRLDILADRVQVSAHDPAGLFYGVVTLVQLLSQTQGTLPCGVIEDYPDFPVRGVMLDISRNKVPTMATLFELIDKFASWKLNHLELYTEHTFAYRNHQDVWADASPMTAEEIRRLDVYCRERFIDLVPNQNSFGHLTRWLTKPAYQELAESPNGGDTPWGTHNPLPNSLNPVDPRSLALLRELYDELLPNFSSQKFNVGCDETWDLGQGKCKALCEQRGNGRVYLDFLLKLHQLVKGHGKTMHFWGDIIIKHPELVAELPGDVVVLEWGYEADHPFDEHGAKFAAAGLPFYVCPGTSSWNSIAGRTENGITNLRAAAENGLKHGATGYLITDWGDNGHWQYLPVSYLGFMAGAAMAWNVAGNSERNWPSVLDTHVFYDRAGVMGRIAYDLGNAYLKCGHLQGNASMLFKLLHEALDMTIPETVTEVSLRATQEAITEVMSSLAGASMKCQDANLVADEFQNTARMLLHACDRGLMRRCENTENAEVLHQLGSDMNLIISEHRRLWLARNRPGGLPDSERVFRQREKEYL
ncbi:MAG: glycoside hydrolase family 20 zincin-like fold domain-containing protein [bacterium]|jgi:hexosaminidase